MRLLIAAPAKAGNLWLKCLLRSIYDLGKLEREEKPDGSAPAAFAAWVAAGGWPDGTIFHKHYRYSPALCDAVEAAPGRVVTIVRDPYDLFVSLYFYVQVQVRQADEDRRAAWRADPKQSHAMVGKPLDDPDVLAFLANGFGGVLANANDWLHGGRAVALRYEGLHADPLGELGRATERIAPVEPSRIAAAVEQCRAENMRRKSERSAAHVRSATVGDSGNHLSAAHLAVFRERHADRVRALGYEVR